MTFKRTTIFVLDEEWREFMFICNREGENASQKVREFIRTYNERHRVGNPQLPMTKFTQPQLVEKSCEHPGCTQLATWVDYPKLKTAKPKIYQCEAHHKHALDNQLLKKSKLL